MGFLKQIPQDAKVLLLTANLVGQRTFGLIALLLFTLPLYSGDSYDCILQSNMWLGTKNTLVKLLLSFSLCIHDVTPQTLIIIVSECFSTWQILH